MVPGRFRDFNSRCLKWAPNSVMKWLAPTSFFHAFGPNLALTKRFAQVNIGLLKNGRIHWAQVVTNGSFLYTNGLWNGTCVPPYHTGNVHRDILSMYIYIVICIYIYIYRVIYIYIYRVRGEQTKISYPCGKCMWMTYPGSNGINMESILVVPGRGPLM